MRLFQHQLKMKGFIVLEEYSQGTWLGSSGDGVRFCQLLEEHPVDLKDRRIYFCGLIDVVGSSKFVRLL